VRRFCNSGRDDAPRGGALIRPRAAAGIAAAGATVAGALWWRRHPSACPYSQRFWVEAPHPLITRARLRDVLEPQPGERVLEVGPGTGYYSLEVAQWISPGGQLDVFDVQQQMLDHTMRRARERGVGGITPTRGDARCLHYPDDSFDAAYLVTVLGEIPDQAAAVRELARVLKPGGRLVVGELVGDPHWVSPGRLREHADSAGLRFVRRSGPPLGYFARFER
jgi:SAM-dependent methyltransferase